MRALLASRHDPGARPDLTRYTAGDQTTTPVATIRVSRIPSLHLPRRAVLALVLALLSAAAMGATYAPAPRAIALSNGLALTPPMGWNSWYWLQCGVNAQAVEQTAYAMVTSGMKDAGYTYVNVDDCWQGERGADGTINADRDRFPDGMQPVVDYVHSLGLKFGIYTDAGSETCMGKAGSLDHEQQDADTYASWGVDFVKVDWCNADGLDPPTQYTKMRDALQSASADHGWPMVFSICDWGVDSPWAWGPSTGNMWRTTSDDGYGEPEAQWSRMIRTLDQNAAHAAVAHPGAWNDPDVLQVGLGSMSDIEDRSQFTLWAMMAAPLLVSNDLSNMADYTKQTVTNHDVIAIDQDAAGIQGTVVKADGSGQLQIWSKPLKTPGTWAVALFNRGNAAADMKVDWSDIGLKASAASVKDVWAGTQASPAQGGYSANVPSHGVVLLEVSSSSPR